MSHTDPDRYVTRLFRDDYPILQGLVASGRLRRAAVSLPGWDKATVFEPLVPVSAHGDHHLRLGYADLGAQIYALPSAPYAAVLRASGDYRQPAGIAGLQVCFGAPDLDAATFRAELRASLAQPLKLDSTPHLATADHGGCHATWWPNRTLILESGGDWFLALAFNLETRVIRSPGKSVFGIDLNADPALCIADSAGVARMIGPRHALLDGLRREHLDRPLAPKEVRVVRALGYASGRGPLEVALRDMLSRAEAVGVEKLDTRQLYARFVERSREQAALDWHVSWLPQALYRARIRLHRVDPAFSTQACHRHPSHLGIVRGRMFDCPLCTELQHRDKNAARNIQARTLAVHRHPR
ncbi:zinc ribbon domain-containing protein [Deinococcus radiotolerans]|uniref:Cas12f1-like TNB domain-containing protein n=1 Tax=Deinococcus radiotolerans TaxID=1309407 RepID=A0ABQ2FNG8_9DEIO|nr:zinc ribbon domain-containing protein [Deinococcus radiotolerans]GGL11357.1 hypothetical protein GCM10010844_32550 [Deinococcus radiotolerans]